MFPLYSNQFKKIIMEQLIFFRLKNLIVFMMAFAVILSCSKDEAIETMELEEVNIPEEIEINSEIILDETTNILTYGYLEDWGSEYEGTRMYAIDLFSEDYSDRDPFMITGIKVGTYFYSSSDTSFTMGTYKFKNYETIPGSFFGSIRFYNEGIKIDQGTITVVNSEEIYSVTIDVSGFNVATGKRRAIKGKYEGTLSYWSIDD